MLSPAAAALAAVAHNPLASGAEPEAALKQLAKKRGDVAEQLRDVERQVRPRFALRRRGVPLDASTSRSSDSIICANRCPPRAKSPPTSTNKHTNSTPTNPTPNRRRAARAQIYDLESKYLEGCNPAANALRGYEGLMSQPVQQYKKPSGHVRAEDRLFSGSSLTGWAHLPGAP